MASTFGARITELMDQVGGGELCGHLIVDQVYAQYQHEDMALNHPRGGGAKYLSTPLFGDEAATWELVAKTFLDDGGKDGMIEAMEILSEAIKVTAPVEYNNLRRSGHPIVTDDGHIVYDREPEVHRLSEAEIAALKAANPSGWVMIHGMPVYVGKGTVG